MCFVKKFSRKLKSCFSASASAKRRCFSTFQLLNFSTLAFAVAALLAAPANATPPPDTQLSLGEVGLPTWMPSYTGGKFVQPTAAYPISAACAPVAPESPVTATSVKDVQTTWTLAA